MDSVKLLLVLCTIVSAIGLYESATVSFTLDPVRPDLVGDLTFTCEANYNTNKLKKLSVLAGSSEILSYQPDQRPRVQWKSDQIKTRFDFKKELSKTRTFIQMTLKKPKCHDQNIYKCIYYQVGQEPKMEEIRVNFYVDKGKVEMFDNRQSECAPINITCVGQAGNPPEQMKWLKKRKGDSTYEPIEASYITTDRLTFNQNNCSNTRVEHFRYNPSLEETDLVIKCGFGDETEHMSFHSPILVPENFQITAKPEGQHKVGEEIQLTCAGLGVTDMIKFKWSKKTKGEVMVDLMPEVSERTIGDAGDMCRVHASQAIAYTPEVDDEVIICEVTDHGEMATASYSIQLGVISNPTDGITTKDKDEDKSMEEKAEPEPEEPDHHMTTSMPSSEEEMEPEMEKEVEPETKPEPDTKEVAPTPKKETKDSTTMKAAPAKESTESGQLRSCLSSVVLISSMLIIAFQFLIEQSS